MDPISIIRENMIGKSLRSYALELGISAAYLSDVLNDKREPGPKILDALGLERETRVTHTYRLAQKKRTKR